jgi:BolA-like protein 3
VTAKLAAAFPGCTATVTDTSGGCGSMFQVSVVSEAFAGLSTPRQHQAVAAAIADEIKGWHGWTCETQAAS